MKNINQHVAKMAQHLNMKEEEIHNMFLDFADEFLKDYAGSSNAALVWKATPEFWGWWEQVWINRDLMVLKRYPQRITAHNRVQMYAVWHNPNYINVKPNSVVYDGFKKVMKERQILLKQLT